MDITNATQRSTTIQQTLHSRYNAFVDVPDETSFVEAIELVHTRK